MPQPQATPLTTNSNKQTLGFRSLCSRDTLNNHDGASITFQYTGNVYQVPAQGTVCNTIPCRHARTRAHTHTCAELLCSVWGIRLGKWWFRLEAFNSLILHITHQEKRGRGRRRVHISLRKDQEGNVTASQHEGPWTKRAESRSRGRGQPSAFSELQGSHAQGAESLRPLAREETGQPGLSATWERSPSSYPFPTPTDESRQPPLHHTYFCPHCSSGHWRGWRRRCLAVHFSRCGSSRPSGLNDSGLWHS